MLVKLCVPAACCNSTSASQATNETELNESAITEDMKQATDYAQVLVSHSKCDTTCMHEAFRINGSIAHWFTMRAYPADQPHECHTE